MLKFQPLEVLSRQSCGDGALEIALAVPPQLQAQFTGVSGQHIVLRCSINQAEVRRTYSLINRAGTFPLRIAVRRHARGAMSTFLFETLEVGATLDVLPPNGSFHSRFGEPAALDARSYVAFAAGCGITPILAILHDVLKREPASTFTLFYGNRTAQRIMCLDELLGLKNRYLERFMVSFLLSAESQDVAVHNGRLDGERVKELAAGFFDAQRIDECFVCGPDSMIDSVTSGLQAVGIADSAIHAEHFTLDSVSERTESRVEAAADQSGAQVTVIMDGRRRTFEMWDTEESVLDAALSQGIELPYSCCAGVCSTCRTKLVEGEVVMAENYALEDWEVENGYVLVCQARPRTATLTIDYDEL